MDAPPRTIHAYPVPTNASPELTTSGLAYLFASKLVPMVRPWTIGGGVMVPCQNIEVRKKPLAALLLATALWNLRQRGNIRLAMYKESTWIPFRKRSRINIEVTRREQAYDGGLERVILANLLTSGPRNASNVIYWFCLKAHSINPWNDVVAVAAAEVSSVSHGCDKLATLEGAFHSFVGRWQGFKMSEPVLHKALLDECERGMVSAASIVSGKRGLGDIVSDDFDRDRDGNMSDDFDRDRDRNFYSDFDSDFDFDFD